MILGQRTSGIGHSVHARWPRSAQPSALRPQSSILTPFPSPLTLHRLYSSAGFTFLEIFFVLFLLTVVVVVVLPRVNLNEDLRSTGRTLIGVLRTLQGLATTGQKPIKLYLDLDRGLYWMVIIEDKEERLPLDPAWKLPRSLPESIRLTEVSIGQDRRMSGQAGLLFFTNGRMEPVTMYLTDEKNNLLGLEVNSLTGGIRVSDERFDPPPYRFIPDRVKTLLKPNTQAGGGTIPRGLFPGQQ